jgi:hypothetical protein
MVEMWYTSNVFKCSDNATCKKQTAAVEFYW